MWTIKLLSSLLKCPSLLWSWCCKSLTLIPTSTLLFLLKWFIGNIIIFPYPRISCVIIYFNDEQLTKHFILLVLLPPSLLKDIKLISKLFANNLLKFINLYKYISWSLLRGLFVTVSSVLCYKRFFTLL